MKFESNSTFSTPKTTALFFLLVVSLVFAGHAFVGERDPFASSELRFTEGSYSGLSIVPASCPSDPHVTGQCDPPPQPSTIGCVIFAESAVGGGVVLGWNSRGLSNLAISPGVGSVGTSGTLTVYPSSATTYTVHAIATQDGSSITCSDTSVGSPPPSLDLDPPEVTFWAEPLLVQKGSASEVHWTAENVTTCYVLQNSTWTTSGDVTDYSTTTPALQSQTRYTLRCTGVDTTIVNKSVTIDIVPIECEFGVEGCNTPPPGTSAAPANTQFAAAAQATTDGSAGESDLSMTIRSAILSDPRTAQMSEAEIDAMVAALAQEAETQGVTPYDILWRPQEEGEMTAQESGAVCGFLCRLNNAFGLDGSDMTIPAGLGITAAILLFVIGSLLHHRYGHHPLAGRLES